MRARVPSSIDAGTQFQGLLERDFKGARLAWDGSGGRRQF